LNYAQRDRLFRDGDRPFRAKPKNRSPSCRMTGHVAPESSVTFARYWRSRCSGIRKWCRDW